MLCTFWFFFQNFCIAHSHQKEHIEYRFLWLLEIDSFLCVSLSFWLKRSFVLYILQVWLSIFSSISRRFTLSLSSSNEVSSKDDIASKDAIGAGPSCFRFRGEHDLDLSILWMVSFNNRVVTKCVKLALTWYVVVYYF